MWTDNSVRMFVTLFGFFVVMVVCLVWPSFSIHGYGYVVSVYSIHILVDCGYGHGCSCVCHNRVRAGRLHKR